MTDDFPHDPPSAFSDHLGYRLTGWSENYGRYELDLKAFHANRQGLPHGGIHATLLDSAMGICGCWTGSEAVRQMTLTLSLDVQYLGRPAGTRLIAEARKTGGGRSIFFAEGDVRDDTGLLIAKGTGVFRYRSRPAE